MRECRFDNSIELNNRLELDHYETARDFFSKFGSNDAMFERVQGVFEGYDDIRDEIVEDCKKEPHNFGEDYIEAASQFSEARAFEILEAARADHKADPNSEEPEVDEKSLFNSWRRAKS